MRGINKVILIGNSGKETEFKTLKDGTPVAKLALATTETYHLKNGETQSRTDWHTIIAWRGLATLAREYIRKGSLLCIEGRLRNRQYEDKDGVKKYVTEIVADQIIMLDKKGKPVAEEIHDENADELPF
jgi:single-strand DNA-binding protein